VFKEYEEWAKPLREVNDREEVVTVESIVAQELLDVQKKKATLEKDALRSTDLRIIDFSLSLRQYFIYNLENDALRGRRTPNLQPGEKYSIEMFRSLFGEGFPFFENLVCKY